MIVRACPPYRAARSRRCGSVTRAIRSLGLVASSTSDATGAGRGRSMLAFHSVVSVLLRALGDFSLHPQGRPAGGLRPPSAGRTVLGSLAAVAVSESFSA